MRCLFAVTRMEVGVRMEAAIDGSLIDWLLSQWRTEQFICRTTDWVNESMSFRIIESMVDSVTHTLPDPLIMHWSAHCLTTIQRFTIWSLKQHYKLQQILHRLRSFIILEDSLRLSIVINRVMLSKSSSVSASSSTSSEENKMFSFCTNSDSIARSSPESGFPTLTLLSLSNTSQIQYAHTMQNWRNRAN